MSFMNHFQAQPKVTKMLMNSYKKGRLAHAYLFEGETGTPKKEMALDFAKLLYCFEEEKPCQTCNNCRRISNFNHPNVIFIEPDGNTLKKEQILYLQKEYVQTSLEEGPKIYIIDQIDKMSDNAANSILKFIEEPASHVYTILITDHIHQILPTIKSRCQILNFQPVNKQQLEEQLKAAHISSDIARISSQLTNDFEVALEMAQDETFIQLIDFVHRMGMAIVIKNDDPIVLCEESSLDLYNDKIILNQFISLLLLYMRDLQKVKRNYTHIVFQQYVNDFTMVINQITEDTITHHIKELLRAQMKLQTNANHLLLLNSLLIKMNKVV